ncbi:MAG: permease [Sulfuricurvum sp. MLSB]|uniref:permease n=3 Tax=unclassified Sulfuricurvum TaxID=2632390 RepID=UPI0005033CB7|nr:permease [Sulfuricurvum sp. MLSB]KFN39744.1 MAG: permease [Sulfuricurvum sp. MLSB]
MWQELSGTIVLDWLGFSGRMGDALHFFLYDTIKIWFLLLAIIFAVSFLRTWFNTEKVRAYLAGKREFTGNVLAALFGIITPFCTCSAIPLFLGFLQARIPIGVTFSFLISAPLNNEIAIAMLFSLFGWKITAIYIGFGLAVAILGGWLIGRFNVEKYVLISVPPLSGDIELPTYVPSFKERVNEAWGNTRDIFRKIYLWVMVGVGVGAWFHGYVPAEFIAQYAGGDAWYAVPVAVLMGIPMYASAAGVMPLVEVLTQKGMLLGSALSFMMAVTALSLPEAIILKQILHIRLIALFFAIIGAGIMGIGFLFNTIL